MAKRTITLKFEDKKWKQDVEAELKRFNAFKDAHLNPQDYPPEHYQHMMLASLSRLAHTVVGRVTPEDEKRNRSRKLTNAKLFLWFLKNQIGPPDDTRVTHPKGKSEV